MKRCKLAKLERWAQNVLKNKRLKGEDYKNKNGQEKEKSSLGPPCTSEFCKKSSLCSCELIKENRKFIFNKFWSIGSWMERHLYIQTLVVKVAFQLLL